MGGVLLFERETGVGVARALSARGAHTDIDIAHTVRVGAVAAGAVSRGASSKW